MARAEVERVLPVPIDRVFEVISDHAGYSRLSGVRRSELVREGDQEPNGLGALRRIHSASGIRFDEEITHFERPFRMDYLIRDVNVPMVHDGGSVRLEPRAETTYVHWVSEWQFATRLWRVLGLPTGRLIAFAFGRMLDDAGRIAATGDTGL